MPTAKLGDVELYYEITGEGTPLVWSHEFGGDYRSWEPQVRYFSRRYRVVTWNYRGYPPSDALPPYLSSSRTILRNRSRSFWFSIFREMPLRSLNGISTR